MNENEFFRVGFHSEFNNNDLILNYIRVIMIWRMIMIKYLKLILI